MDNRVLGMLMRVAKITPQAMAQTHALFSFKSPVRHKVRAQPGMGNVTIGKDSGVRKRIRAIRRNGPSTMPPDALERAQRRHIHPRSKRP